MKVLLLVMSFISVEAFAWGPVGHRAVGEIAQKHLDPRVSLKISKILGGHSLSRVSTWPDEIKSEPQTYQHTYNWHYTDWKDDDHQHNEENSSGKLLTSIRDQVAVLKDPQASREKKEFAIKFIVHLVGDLHQPLHVGNGLDQGGNKCKVLFHGKEMNLHSLWDEGMIDFTKLSYTELANYVSQGRKLSEIRAWKSGDVVDWAKESKDLRGNIYPDNVVASEALFSQKEYCRSDITVAQEQMPKLGYEYSYKFIPVVELRLFQAGLRLAQILNQALN